MANWDARWKLATLLLACASVAALQTPDSAAIALALALLLALRYQISPRRLLARLGVVVLGLIPFVAVLPFVESGDLALTIALRALAIGTLALVLLTGPLHRTLAAAHSLGMPGPLVQITLLTARYATTFADELRRLRIAWHVRGFRPRCNRATWTTLAHGLGAILVRSDDRGERVSAAMRARGFDGSFRSLAPFHTRIADVLVSVTVLALFAAPLMLERLA